MTLGPDSVVLRRHLRFLFSAAATIAELQLEIAWGAPEHGPRNARLFRIVDLDDATNFACAMNQSGCNVYVSTTIKSAETPSNRRTGAAGAVLATCLPIDIDRNLVAGARRLPGTIKPQLLAISGTQPTLRGHLWIAIQPTRDLDLLEQIACRAIARCGGDMAARGRALLMRLAGSISFPSEKKKQRGYLTEPVTGHFMDAPAYTLAALGSAFPQQSSSGGLNARPFGIRGDLRAFPSADIQHVQSALDELPEVFAEKYELWIRVGLALHSFDPSIRGLLLWRQFSERCRDKAALTDFEYRWRTFGRRTNGRQITIRWLFAQARIHRWQSHAPRRRSRGG